MTKRGVDFTQFDAWIEKYKKVVANDEVERFLRSFLIEQAERLLTLTKEKTPVDTGALRDSWEIGEISFSGKNMIVEILNTRDYASDVEYGHRIVVGGQERGFVDGRYMLTISLDEIYEQMDSRFQIQFKQWCAEKGLGD